MARVLKDILPEEVRGHLPLAQVLKVSGISAGGDGIGMHAEASAGGGRGRQLSALQKWRNEPPLIQSIRFREQLLCAGP